MNVEFMCGLLANYSKELSEAETYREKGDVQLKHAKLILNKVKNCSIPAIMGELTCDSCGCHPNTMYQTSKGRFCERCKQAS